MCNHTNLTTDQKIQATEMREKNKTYAVIADFLGIELSLLKYRLPQHLRAVRPDLLNKHYNKNRKMPEKRKALTAEDIVHYKHNVNTATTKPLNREVRVIIAPAIKDLPTPIMRLSDRLEARRLTRDDINNLAYCGSRKTFKRGFYG